MAECSVAFDRAADYYDATRGYPPGEEIAVARLLAQVGHLTPNNRVLEIGVGTGRIALPLSVHTGAYFGIDLSRPMMNCLRAKQQREAVYVAEADATRLPFADDTFDSAVAVHVFHLIPNWQDALAELRRVLRPGAALVHCWSKDDDLFRPLWDAWGTVNPAKADQSYGVNWRDRLNFLEEEGWQPIDEASNHIFTTQTTPQEFLDAIKGRIWSACWRYSDEELANGLTAMETLLPSIYPDLDTSILRIHTIYARAYQPPQ
jgi:ubiquinone/menaquinone biosynthesis C-methylase UbiE